MKRLAALGPVLVGWNCETRITERRLHGDAFALNSFLTIRPHPLRDGVPTVQGWPSAGWGELMPVARRNMAIERGKTIKFLWVGNSSWSNQVFSPRQEFLVLAATIKGNGESIMATKITTALVAALVVGALMIPNHEALARGGGGFGGGGFHGGGFGGGGFHRGGFHGGGFGFQRGFGRGYGFGHGFGYGRRFGFYGGYPYFYGGYGYGCSPYYYGSYECYWAARRAAPMAGGRGGAHPHGATGGSVVIAAGPKHPPEYSKA
jgi:hypothetical protein